MNGNQSQVSLCSKVVRATARPWIRLNGYWISRLQTSGPDLAKMRQNLSSLQRLSVITKFLMLDSFALPLKERTYDFSFSFHFACLLTHLSIFSRNQRSPQHSSKNLSGISVLGRQMFIFLGPESPRKLDSQQMVALLYFCPYFTRVNLLLRKVDSRVAILVQANSSPFLSLMQMAYSHIPSFLTVIMCSLVSCSRMRYSIIPDLLFLSLRSSHWRVCFLAIRSKMETLSMRYSDFGIDFPDFNEGLESLSSTIFIDCSPSFSVLSNSCNLIFLTLRAKLTHLKLPCAVPLLWLTSSSSSYSEVPALRRILSAFLSLSWKRSSVLWLKPLSSMISSSKLLWSSKRISLISSSSSYLEAGWFFRFFALAWPWTVFSTSLKEASALALEGLFILLFYQIIT